MRTRKKNDAPPSCFTRLAKAFLILSVSFGLPASQSFDVQNRCVAVSRSHKAATTPSKQKLDHPRLRLQHHEEPSHQYYLAAPAAATNADRRTALVGTARSIALLTGACSSVCFDARVASANPSLPGQPPPRERRQLELCLVAVLRVTFWAEALAEVLEPTAVSQGANTVAATQESTLPQKPLIQASYLDARLGAKGMLTGRVGSGASYRAYTLATLQVPNCLQDLQYYRPSAASTAQDFREALASLVEFDGMDSLLDASPRTSLTLAQYSDAKRIYVVRILREQVVPLGRKLVNGFDAAAVDRAMSYILSYYSSELTTPVPSPSATL